MRLHLRTVPEEEAEKTFPARVLAHAQLNYNAMAVIITGEFGQRFGYFEWRNTSPQPFPEAPGKKDGELRIDDPARAAVPCDDEDGCGGDHFLEASCDYLEMAAAAKKLLGQ